jgi:D-beta-D-heptose 7-phosphate kinase / D-beta-D-heptose 1-phosphate adenosyltransferase
VPFDFHDRKIAVIGDVMLDAYMSGTVSRISPEAPVPIVHLHREHHSPGGAANVAANIAGLGGKVKLVGLTGRDRDADTLNALLDQSGAVDRSTLVTVTSRPTIVKTRIVGERQQIVRVDREDKSPLPEPIIREIINSGLVAIDWADVVVLSDYGKGTLTADVLRSLIDAARRAGKRTIVDPKRSDVEVYAGADYITPNRAELTLATGLGCETDTEAEKASAALIARTHAAVILTRSAQGMSHFAAGAEPVHLPTFARAVYDVSGAGDTVVATLALGIASGLPIGEVMRLANHAAGIVVAKIGTAIVSAEELQAVILAESHPAVPQKGALVDLDTALQMRETWRRQGLKVGFTNGCFDLLHPGHISLLEQAAAASDRLIVAINTDASVRRLKGETRPVQGEAGRARVIGALASVDLVILFDQDTPFEVIKALMPDVLIKGADYTVDTVVGAAEVIAAGGQVVLADLTAGQSSSNLISRAASSSQTRNKG